MAIVGFVVLKVTNTRTGRFFGRGPPAFAEGKLSPDFSPTDGLVLRFGLGNEGRGSKYHQRVTRPQDDGNGHAVLAPDGPTQGPGGGAS